MLNPSPIVDAIVEVLQNIPTLSAAMTAEDESIRISAFHFRMGAETRLAQAIYEMPSPSMIVVWEGTQGGNFNGSTIWKHRFGVYYRMANMAGNDAPVGYEDLWTSTVNDLPEGSAVNIRYMTLYPGLDIMDTPSADHMLDEDLLDRFKGTFVIPEIGDN